MNSLRNKGQAVIEYILLLVVVVGIAYGLLYKFNTAFREFSANLFTGYIACLLETGEIPSLLGGKGECADEFQPFDLAKGKSLPPIPSRGGGGSSGGSGSGGSGTNGGSNNSSSGKGSTSRSSSPPLNPGQNQATDGGGRGEGGGSGGGRAGRNGSSSFTPFNSSSNRGSSTAGAGEARGAAAAGSKKSLGFLNVQYQGSPSAASQSEYRGLLGRQFTLQNGELPKNEGPVTTSLSKQTSEATALRPQTLSLSISEKKPESTATESESSLNFSNIVRIILIVIILIGLVVLFGGQVLQFVKSQEK